MPALLEIFKYKLKYWIYVKKEGIMQYIGLDKLTYEEKSILKSLAEKTHQRLKEMLHNQTDLVVHLKEEHKEGARKEYHVLLRCIAPTKMFESHRAKSWHLNVAAKESFADLMIQIKKAFPKVSL